MTPTAPSSRHAKCFGSVMDHLHRADLQLGEELEQRVVLLARQAGEELHYPLLMRARHLAEGSLPGPGEADAKGAPVRRLVQPLDQTFLRELVDDRGDIAPGH